MRQSGNHLIQASWVTGVSLMLFLLCLALHWKHEDTEWETMANFTTAAAAVLLALFTVYALYLVHETHKVIVRLMHTLDNAIVMAESRNQ
jgi:hypothetical protein